MRFLRSPLVWVGLAVSVGALFLALRGLQWSEVGRAVAEANYGLLALSLAIMLLSLYLRGVRWGVLFYPRRGMGIGNLVGAMNVGYAFNNLLPLRVGELVRAYLIGEAEKVSAAHALSTIVVERVLDVLTIVLMLVVLLPFIDAPAWVTGPGLVAGIAFLALAVALVGLSAARERAMALVDWAVRFLPERLRERARQGAAAAIGGFEVLRRPGAVAQAAAWSAASWLTSAVVMFVVLRAFNLDLGFTAALFVLVSTSLVMLVPASPGYIGTFELTAIKGLEGVFDVSHDAAASYALALHAILYLTPIVIAAAFLWRERRTWRQVRLWARGEAPVGVPATPTASGGTLGKAPE